MADDKTKVALDAKLISLTEDYEVRAWCDSLCCEEQALRQAVEAVGHSAEAVRNWIYDHDPRLDD